MPESLHIPNLSIENFRAIDRLSIPNLERVTLIVGENSVGKTTILDAVRAFADSGNFLTLRALLQNREEVLIDESVDDALVRVPNWPALFHGREARHGAVRIKVANHKGSHLLQLDDTYASHAQMSLLDENEIGRARVLRASFNGTSIEHPYQAERPDEPFLPTPLRGPDRMLDRRLVRSYAEDWPFPRIPYESIGPGIIDSDRIARYLDRVTLTPLEQRATDALRLIFGETVERPAAVADDTGGRLRRSRRTLVKFFGEDTPVPLASLGDGAIRLFGVGLAIANASGGLLLIDEAENGLHHRLQADFWRLIIGAARESNVQVIATTHSWDCVRGFQQAAASEPDESGVLYRLERGGTGLRVIVYDDDRLARATKHHVEIR